MRPTAPTADLPKSAAPMCFGSFECAMVLMAPRCTHCNCRIAGAVVRSDSGAIYCGAQCANESRARVQNIRRCRNSA
jgi:hypothetical protein